MTLEEYAQRLKAKLHYHRTTEAPQNLAIPTPSWEKYPQWVLEIGCGAGLHPILYAGENTTTGVVALERTVEKFQKFLGRHQRHQYPNLFPLHADGLQWLATLENPLYSRFEKVFLLYPNPYPKNTQRNKRFMGMVDFQHVLNSLKDHGEIIMRSNERGYLDESLYLAKEVWQLECIKGEKVILKEGQKGVTHFERKYLERGESCWEIIWKKN